MNKYLDDGVVIHSTIEELEGWHFEFKILDPIDERT